jgi:hypothetical protein
VLDDAGPASVDEAKEDGIELSTDGVPRLVWIRVRRATGGQTRHSVQIDQFSAEFFAEHSITVRLNTAVTAIDSKAKTVALWTTKRVT